MSLHEAVTLIAATILVWVPIAAPPAVVAGPATVTIEIVDVTPAGIVEQQRVYQVIIVDAVDLGGIQVELHFDPMALEFVESSAGTIRGGTYLPPALLPSQVNWLWQAPNLAPGNGPSGDLLFFTVTFRPLSTNAPDPVLRNGTGETAGGVRRIEEASLFREGDILLTYSYVSQYEVDIDATENDSPEATDLADANGNPHAPEGSAFPPPPSHAPSPPLVWTPNETIAVQSHAGGTTPLIVAPSHIFPDQSIVVSATLCNTTSEASSRDVALLVDGHLEEVQSVVVSGGSCQEVAFTVSRSAPGTYEIAIDDITGEFTVLPGIPAPPPPPGSEVVPPPAQNGIGTPVILAIVGVMLLLIAALVFFFRRT